MLIFFIKRIFELIEHLKKADIIESLEFSIKNQNYILITQK